MDLKIDYTDNLPQENEYIEYKKSKSGLSKDAWETISAFANTDVGLLILGVEELATHSFTISGVQDPQKIYDDLWSGLTNPRKISTNTITNTDVRTVTVKTNPGIEKKIIQIRVREARDNDKPVYINHDQQNMPYQQSMNKLSHKCRQCLI